MNFIQKMMASLTAPKKKMPSWNDRRLATSARHKKRAAHALRSGKIKTKVRAYLNRPNPGPAEYISLDDYQNKMGEGDKVLRRRVRNSLSSKLDTPNR